jgi:hypothetical protein
LNAGEEEEYVKKNAGSNNKPRDEGIMAERNF